MAVRSKVRLYDLAKELKIDTKRLIEIVRSHGADVSVPSNSISPTFAQAIRDELKQRSLPTQQRVVRLIPKAPSNPIAATHRYDTVAGPSAETPPLKKKKIRRCPLCPFEMITKSGRRRHFISDHPEEVLGGKLLSSLKARELCDLIPAEFGDLVSAATLAGFALRKESDEVSAQLLEELVRHVRLAKEKLDALRATTMMDLDRF
jgi:hypothetical protein